MKSRTLYETIYQELLAAISNGVYAGDRRLPSEKELAEQYGVSRITSQKALNRLAEDGHILRVPGKGSFVNRKTTPVQTPLSKALPAQQRIVGYIVRGIGPSYGLELLHSIEEACKKCHFVLAVRFASSEAEEERCIDELLGAGACGLIVVCIHGETYSERILRLVLDHFPIVLLDRGLQGIPASYVGTDNVRAAAELTQLLLQEGAQDLCCVSCRVGEQDIDVIADRVAGFREEMMRCGHIPSEETDLLYLEHEGFARYQDAVEANLATICQYIQQHREKDGYLCTSYDAAEEMDIALTRLGLREEKKIVCFGRIDSLLLKERFTHIKQDERTMGQEAVRILSEALEGHMQPQKVLVPYMVVKT